MPSLCALSALLPLERIIFFFITRRLFSLLLFLFLPPASTIYIPVLPLPCSIQWMPFLFLLLNSRHLFFSLFLSSSLFPFFCPSGSHFYSLPLPHTPSAILQTTHISRKGAFTHIWFPGFTSGDWVFVADARGHFYITWLW